MQNFGKRLNKGKQTKKHFLAFLQKYFAGRCYVNIAAAAIKLKRLFLQKVKQENLYINGCDDLLPFKKTKFIYALTMYYRDSRNSFIALAEKQSISMPTTLLTKNNKAPLFTNITKSISFYNQIIAFEKKALQRLFVQCAKPIKINSAIKQSNTISPQLLPSNF